MKIILNKFASKCAKTGRDIPPNIPVYWQKGYGVWALETGETLPSPKVQGPPPFDPAPFMAAIASLTQRVEQLETLLGADMVAERSG